MGCFFLHVTTILQYIWWPRKRVLSQFQISSKHLHFPLPTLPILHFSIYTLNYFRTRSYTFSIQCHVHAIIILELHVLSFVRGSSYRYTDTVDKTRTVRYNTTCTACTYHKEKSHWRISRKQAGSRMCNCQVDEILIAQWQWLVKFRSSPLFPMLFPPIERAELTGQPTTQWIYTTKSL